MRYLALLLSITLTACAPHATLAPTPPNAQPAGVVPVFTATNRALTPSGPGVDRAENLHLRRVDVAVPPLRAPGDIRYPGSKVDPETEFTVTRTVGLADRRAFRAALGKRLRQLPPDERDVLIYVHGFNNNFADGVLRMAQLTHDLKLKGVALHFSWPSAANPLAYAYDRDSALLSRDALEEMIEIARVPGARRVAIVAHSMGGFLTMETLRQMAIARPGSVARKVDGVILISPDLDVDVFRAQARRIGDLPETFAVFLSNRDRALRLSAQLTGLSERLGSLDDPSRIAEFDVTLVNITEFSSGAGHFSLGTSPALISILARAVEIDNAFASDASGVTGLVPGSVLTVQNVTEFVLTAGGN